MKPFLQSWIVLITVGVLISGVFCNQGNAEEEDVKSGVVEPEKDEEVVVFYKGPYPEKGFQVSFPKTVSVSEKGKKFKCEYTITNYLGESVFVSYNSYYGQSYRYEYEGEIHAESSGSSEDRKTSYALLHSGVMIKKEQGMTFSHGPLSAAHHLAEVLIPEDIRPGGILTISIMIHGYYMKNGRGFSGSLDLPIKVTE